MHRLGADPRLAMRIEHVAVWTPALEEMKAFYETYFQASAGDLYVSRRQRGFQSYFLTFAGGARLELMTIGGLERGSAVPPVTGYAHLAISTGSKGAVDALTERLRRDGHTVLEGPRETGDGYYESLALDPDGNRIEITI